MAFFVFGQNLKLKKVLVCLKKRKLFEQSFPGDLAMIFVFIEFPGNHGGFLELSQERVLGLLCDVVSGIH